MAILIDPPLWPAHGTTFSHLISDVSLVELHAFAQAAGLTERAFDLDHYDVPAARRPELIAHGAIAVGAKELIARLRESGLRVPARDRPPALRRRLTSAWQHAIGDWPERTVWAPHGNTAGPLGAPASPDWLGADLIERWAQPHRTYHDLRHLRDVLTALQALCTPDTVPRPVLLAAWFHDAVYNGVPGEDEQASADLALEQLPSAGIGPAEVNEVARLVLLTRSHDPGPGDAHGQLLCDADLSVLGRDEASYARYVADVRTEYAHLPEPDFVRGRTAVVHHLLGLEPLYRTERGRALWDQRARVNLAAELRDLGTRR